MDAADYADWCRFAGIYLGNHSHAERYLTYQAHLSRAGLAVRIVHDFLQDNKGGIDVQAWRTGNVYEMDGSALWRVEQTALALEAVGAPRVAERVRTSRPASPFPGLMPGGPVDLPAMIAQFRANVGRAFGAPNPPAAPDPSIESWEQVEHLLGLYVRAHQHELLGDVAKHGDPRTVPGYDPEARLAELERRQRTALERESQRDRLDDLKARMAEIEKGIAKKAKPSRLATPRRKFLETYRDWTRRPAEELLPEVMDFLPEAGAFARAHSALLFPPPTADAGLLARLEARGPLFDADPDGGRISVRWDAPRGLECEWAAFSLSMDWPAGDDAALGRLLDHLDEVLAAWPTRQEGMRREVLDNFEQSRGWWGTEGIEPTEAGILGAVDGGSVHLTVPEWDTSFVESTAHVSIGWDEEHGLELSLFDDE